MNQRHIPLQGAINFRDIGGYLAANGQHTRPGLIYRSAALSQLTDADRVTLHDLGIQTVFDLRRASDLEREGEDQVGPGIQVIAAPTTMIESGVIQELLRRGADFRLVDYYLGGLEPRAKYHANLFQQILTHSQHPLVIHCSVGKDRTGITIALLLAIVGVSDDDITADYAATKPHLEPLRLSQRPALQQLGVVDAAIDNLYACPPERMQAVLDHLRATYGSVQGYLQYGGVTADAIGQFRMIFLE